MESWKRPSLNCPNCPARPGSPGPCRCVCADAGPDSERPDAAKDARTHARNTRITSAMHPPSSVSDTGSRRIGSSSVMNVALRGAELVSCRRSLSSSRRETRRPTRDYLLWANMSSNRALRGLYQGVRFGKRHLAQSSQQQAPEQQPRAAQLLLGVPSSPPAAQPGD